MKSVCTCQGARCPNSPGCSSSRIAIGHTCRDTPRECVDEVMRQGLLPVSANGPDAAEALALMQDVQAERERQRAEADAWLRGER